MWMALEGRKKKRKSVFRLDIAEDFLALKVSFYLKDE